MERMDDASEVVARRFTRRWQTSTSLQPSTVLRRTRFGTSPVGARSLANTADGLRSATTSCRSRDRCPGGTFRAELFDVAVGDTYVVAVQRATASRGERTLDVTGCQLIRVSNGIIHNVRATTPIR